MLLLVGEQPALGRQAVLIAAQTSRAGDGAVARDERCDEVTAAGTARRACSERQTGLSRELAVGQRLPGRDALQSGPDCLLVRGSRLSDLDRVERREVAVEPVGNGVRDRAEVVDDRVRLIR